MKFYIYTLGCKVNTYESNVMHDLLVNEGYKEANKTDDIDIAIINTCTVTNTADKKSIKTVKQAIKEHPNAIVIVAGCSSQNKKESFESIEGVDIVLGNNNKSHIVNYIKEYKKEQITDVEDMMDTPFESMMLNNFNQKRAFVKIQDGCNNYCAYCIIPYVRGNVRSKKEQDVIDEITELVSKGHKEIVLSGIHTGHYGSDINSNLSKLIKKISEIKGLERIRISSIEITELDEEFLETLKSSKILVDHMHIPLQSGANKTLKEMNRKYDKSYFINKIEKIRKIRPEINITTDVIVGFPGESESDFKETLETIKTIGFSKIHVFPYSRRKGTPADEMDNQIEETVKKQRVKELMELSKKLEIEYMEKFINRKLVFLPEQKKDGFIYGHTSNFIEIKCAGIVEDLNDMQEVTLDHIEYPYVIARK